MGRTKHLVTDEPVEIEKSLVEVQDFRKINKFSREIYGIYLKPIKKTRKVSTCNRLDLKTLKY
jgi:hypothetical protein